MEAPVATSQAPNVPPPPERRVGELKESLKIDIRHKASTTPHLMVNNRITKEGKEVAKAIYQEELGFGAKTPQFVEAAKFIRQDINEELNAYRKNAKLEVLKALQAEGITRRQISVDEFKQKVKAQIAGNRDVQEVQVMRKLLASVVQRSKSADVAQIRLKLKSEVTEEEINARLQVLKAQGKTKLPGRELIRNALAEQRRKVLRESLQAQELSIVSSAPAVEPTKPQTVPEQPVIAPEASLTSESSSVIVPTTEAVPADEQQNTRADLHSKRIRSRIDVLSSSRRAHMVGSILRSGKRAVETIRYTATGIGKNVIKRPLTAAAATLAITGVLGLSNPAAVGATAESILAAVTPAAGNAIVREATPPPSPATQPRIEEIRQQSLEARGQPFMAVPLEFGNPNVDQPQPPIVEQNAPSKSEKAPIIKELVVGHRVILEDASLITLPGSLNKGESDSNNPWIKIGNKIRVFSSSAGGPVISEGESLGALVRDENSVSFDKKLNGNRWLESVIKVDYKLYGWYHYEPLDLFAPEAGGRHLTAPKIGAAVSDDDGKTWHDLGFVLESPQDKLNKDTKNAYFAGGYGDFSVISDQNNEYAYFAATNYEKDPENQGIFMARIKFVDLQNPSGKVQRWQNGKWQQSSTEGNSTPIIRPKVDVHQPNGDFYWGPSIYRDEKTNKFVMLMNRAENANWDQKGIYVSFTDDLSNPNGWSEPELLIDAKGEGSWYPQVIGNRFFVGGKSDKTISIVPPGGKK